MEIGIKQAKTDLSRLVERALRGETIVVSVQGKGRVQLTPLSSKRPGGYGTYRELLAQLPPDWDTQDADDKSDAENYALFNGL